MYLPLSTSNLQFPLYPVILSDITGVIPISLFLLATGTVLRKAAIDRGVRLATGRNGCRYRGGHKLNATGGVIA